MLGKIAALALLASASAQNAGQLGQRMDQLAASGMGFDDSVGANHAAAAAGANRAAGGLLSAISDVQNSVDTQMTSMSNDMAALQATMSNTMSTAQSTADAAISTQAANVASTMAATTASLQATVSTAMGTASTNAAAFQANVNGKLTAKSRCNAAGKFLNATTNQCVGFNTLVLSRMTGTSCTVTGQIRVNAATDRVEVCASGKWMAPVSVVSNSIQHGSDGCENCWLNRQLTFTKRLAETYIRLLWTDVGRSHGWGTEWNRYHIRICDANGANCGDCQDPGHMRTTRHMNQWHGWWTDHYMPMASSGLCRRRNGRNMGAGNYRIRIWCDGGDNVVGWSGNSANIQVDEVYKA